MEVNKHINFLKRRGFLIKESSQLGLDLNVDPIVPQPNVKKPKEEKPKEEKPKEEKPKEESGPDLGIDAPEGTLSFTGMCNSVGGEFCQLIKLSDAVQDRPKLKVILYESITKIYKELLPPQGKNLSRFNRLVSVVLRQSPDSSINTFKLIADELETINTSELVSLRKELGKEDIGTIDDDMVLKLIDSIKYKSYTEYENSFIGSHFKSFKTRLELAYQGELILNKKLSNELVSYLHSGKNYKVLSTILYNNIVSNFKKGIGKFIKADLQCVKPLKDENGKTIIHKDSYVEVKKMDYNLDSYLSEFFAIYKNPVPEELNTPQGLMLYNKVIDDLYLKLLSDDSGIKETVYKSFAGIIYDENRFIESKYIELYWSNRGQRINDHRLSLRFRVKSNNIPGYVYDTNSDVLRTEILDDIKPKPSDVNFDVSESLTEAPVSDKGGKDWKRDSPQGKMIRTKGGTKELDDDFDWAIQQAEITPDDPKVAALIQHFDGVASEVIGEDFEASDEWWYGNHNVYKLQNGEEWVVGTHTSMGNALHEYLTNYVDDVGIEELGIDLSDYVDVSDYWITQFCEEEADNFIYDMSDEDLLEIYDYYTIVDDIKELEEEEDDLTEELDDVSEKLNRYVEAFETMEIQNQEYMSYGYENPQHSEEDFENLQNEIDKYQHIVGKLKSNLEEIPYKRERYLDELREEIKSENVDECEQCMEDPVDCIVNEKGWYSSASEAIEAFGWDVDRDAIVEYMSQDGYDIMSGYDGYVHDEEVNDVWYVLIRVN